VTKDNAFRAILDSLPPKPGRSRLVPYSKLIIELHRRGQTYREITRILSERFYLRTSRSTVNDFVRTPLKSKVDSPKKQRDSREILAERSVQLSKTKEAAEANVAPDEVQARIANVKNRPIPSETQPRLFDYDPDKPLSFLPKERKS
jgi:hypothetical protein